MKKFNIARGNGKANKLRLRSETIRILTEQELTLVAAGNCAHGSTATNVTANWAGIC